MSYLDSVIFLLIFVVLGDFVCWIQMWGIVLLLVVIFIFMLMDVIVKYLIESYYLV